MELKDKLGLSEEEVRQVIRSSRGQGLLCVGSNRIPLTIVATPAEYDLISRPELTQSERSANICTPN